MKITIECEECGYMKTIELKEDTWSYKLDNVIKPMNEFVEIYCDKCSNNYSIIK